MLAVDKRRSEDCTSRTARARFFKSLEQSFRVSARLATVGKSWYTCLHSDMYLVMKHFLIRNLVAHQEHSLEVRLRNGEKTLNQVNFVKILFVVHIVVSIKKMGI